MADRTQITRALLDGPLAFNTIDMEVARIKGIKMLAKNLAYFAKADSAGIVLGAHVSVVLTSRADSARSRMASLRSRLSSPMQDGARRP